MTFTWASLYDWSVTNWANAVINRGVTRKQVMELCPEVSF